MPDRRKVLLLSQPPILHSIIVSFRPAWLARALLSLKRAQSSGNDDVDEGQKTPFETEGKVMSVIFSLFPGLPVATALTLRLVIISFRPAWLARALLSFKRAQSSGND